MKGISAALIACALGCLVQYPAAQAQTETVLHSFGSGTDGYFPEAGVINVNGTLYGTTERGGTDGNATDHDGTVFAFDLETGAETVLHSFGSGTDGAFPEAGLIDVDGTLYGTTSIGGTEGCCGTVFSLDPVSGAETVLYSFCIQASCADGTEPFAGLIDVRGTLYGTTYLGGTGCPGDGSIGCGALFSIDPKTDAETVVYSFCIDRQLPACTDGASPLAGLIDVKGRLYGTTSEGGADSKWNGGCPVGQYCGTVFLLDPKTDAETVLHSFCSKRNCEDGRFPTTSLIEVRGTLYGATEQGGADKLDGALFSIDPKTGREKVLHSFGSGSDGKNPDGGLIDVNGTLYGTTVYGGAGSCDLEGYEGCGTVFAIDPRTGAETVLYSFAGGSDGAYPAAGLTSVNGTLYGTTSYGGAYDAGTVFSFVP